MKQLTYTVLDRFLTYVTVDTQSDLQSPTFPSTEKQKDLARLLVTQLLEIGLSDAHMDAYGYVYATLPSNVSKDVPVICLCSHMDTSPDCSGAQVKPLVHAAYDGRDLVLPDDPDQVIRLSQHPELAQQMGHDIVTASGTTLLGADNKAGLAEIVDAMYQLVQHPDIPHGTIKVLFTPDEEIGRGVDRVDLEKLGARYGYTMDGESLGNLEDETFSADALQVHFYGRSVHTGFAKGRLINALKLASELVDRLPRQFLSPESTEGRQGFVHPLHMNGGGEEAVVDFLIRDFDTARLAEHEALILRLCEEIVAEHPGSRYTHEVQAQYRNMKEILDQHPLVTEIALKAIRAAGIEPKRQSIRGGTDGCRLSFMGLPCPNLFAGEHAFHSKQEWVSVQDMQKAVDVILHLVALWAQETC